MIEPPQLEISVVIPTHNRRDALLATLDALGRQTLAADRFEIIVVIDAGTDDTAEALNRRTFPFSLRLGPAQGRGAAAARNTGAAMAHGERIVFLDDDIVADPHFLTAHLAAGRDGSVVIGQSSPLIAASGWFGKSLEDWWNNRFREMASPGYRMGYMDVMSGNLSLPSALFKQVGGFDATLLCREDFELGLRLVALDAKLRYEPKARGLHHDASTPERNLQRARNEGTADYQIALKHPAIYSWLRCANMTAPSTGARLLRLMCFETPAAGRFALSWASNLLPVLEMLGQRGRWQSLAANARALAYQQGVAAVAGSAFALHSLRDRAVRSMSAPATLKLDLMNGIEAGREAVEERRPDALSVYVGDRLIDQAYFKPGMERLGRNHLDAILKEHVWEWASSVEAVPHLARLTGNVPDWVTDPARLDPAVVSLAELELSDGRIIAKSAVMGIPVKILLRERDRPIGWVFLHAGIAPEDFWMTLRSDIFADRDLCRRITRPQPASSGERPPISVVICTRDRVTSLARCLAALTALDYPNYEILVVDNAPSTPDTETFVRARADLRYCREDRPGLDWARNRGVAEARHDIIAFTDDDTEVDRHWLTGIAQAFAEPDVDFVTGLVLPMKLDTDARHYFENIYGGMGKGFDAQTRDPQSMWTHDILWASALGVGANMAFRRRTFSKAGLFDPALDVGTATRGGGDIEMFHRALARGCVHVYQPSALLWHEHREDFVGLSHQLSDNGSGFACYLLTCLRNRTVSRMAVARFAARAWLWDWQVKRLIRPGRHRRDLVLAEIAGVIRAPRLWREAQRRAKVLAGSRSEQGPGQ